MKNCMITLLVISMIMFAAIANAKDVSLSWDASPSDNVAGYEICYSAIGDVIVQDQPMPETAPLPICVDAGNTLTFTIASLDDDVPYYISAIAYNAAGQKSNFSNVVISHGFVAPQPPRNLRGVSSINTEDVPLGQ